MHLAYTKTEFMYNTYFILPMGNQVTQPIKILQDNNDASIQMELKSFISEFKCAYPSGEMTREDFILLIFQIFPFGESSEFSERLFNNISLAGQDQISIDEIIVSFSILFSGSIFEKLRWIFRFYDENKDGLISKQEMQNAAILFDRMTEYSTVKSIKKEIIEEMFQDRAELTFNDFEELMVEKPDRMRLLTIFLE